MIICPITGMPCDDCPSEVLCAPKPYGDAAEAMRAKCEAIVRAEYNRTQIVALARILKEIGALRGAMTPDLPADMAERSQLTKQVADYLTERFIWSPPSEMPADECVSEAKHVISIVLREAGVAEMAKALATEQTMHAAWRKCAEEAESLLAACEEIARSWNGDDVTATGIANAIAQLIHPLDKQADSALSRYRSKT